MRVSPSLSPSLSPSSRKRPADEPGLATQAEPASKSPRQVSREPHEVQRLRTLIDTYPALRARGIDELRAPHALPAGVRVERNAGMDGRVLVRKVVPGTALGTTGVASCHAICARGVDARDGGDVLALAHVSTLTSAQDAVRDMEAALRTEGASARQVFIVGGSISRRVEPPPVGVERASALRDGEQLLQAFGESVVAARLGLSERQDEGQAAQGGGLAPPTGRPHSVSVVLTADSVFWRADSDEAQPLFEVPPEPPPSPSEGESTLSPTSVRSTLSPRAGRQAT